MSGAKNTLLAALVGSLAALPAAGGGALRDQAQAALVLSEQSLLATLTEIGMDPTRFPRSSDPITGQWTTTSSGGWTSGFFPALCWRVFEHGGNPALQSAAVTWTANLSGEATRTDTHDLGFMIGLPFGHAWRITGQDGYRQTLLTAAASLSSRFDPDVGCLRSWDGGAWQFPVIIDNLMNLELLYRGAALTSDPTLAATWSQQATSHANVSSVWHVRRDHGTYHVVDFDPTSGNVLSRGTYQGFADESIWARGQAWGIHGLTTTARESGQSAFASRARELAQTFLTRLPLEQVPYWDFDAPNIPAEPRDSSAAAIAAAGLLQLALEMDAADDAAELFDRAEQILAALLSPAYFSGGAVTSGLLLHGTGNQPFTSEIDVSLIYGDYYFVEALLRYLELTAPPAGEFCNATDGALAQCPCTNPGLPASGCDNAQATGGVRLLPLWSDASAARALLRGLGFPPASQPTAIVIRSGQQEPQPVVFGDGLRCVATSGLVRMAAARANAGSSHHLLQHGAGGGAFRYQLWYRNTPAAYCSASAFNLSNGVELVWP